MALRRVLMLQHPAYTCSNSHNFFSPVPLFINKARFERANYIFLKMVSILDTTQNSQVYTHTHQGKQVREMCCHRLALVSSQSVPGIETTEV